MELRHLRYFVALADCRSFTQAAARAHVTQSTMSHQIRQLEDEVGHPLVDRIGRKVALTEAGQSFLNAAIRALQEVDAGLALLRPSASRLVGQVRVGATHTFNQALIPECVALFLARHPNVRICVEELSAAEIGTQLRAGLLDLGIAYQPGEPEGFTFEPLFHEEMVLVVGSTHPLAGRRRIRMVELHRQPLVMLPLRYATRVLLDECFAACGAEPAVLVEMSSVAPMIALVHRSPVAAIVAASALPRGMQGVVAVPIESPTPVRTPGLLWAAGATKGALAQAFSTIVRRTALRRRVRTGSSAAPSAAPWPARR